MFAAVSFAIARILGAFRKGGGDVQEAAGTTVQTLRMPLTAKLFLAVMAMGMMALMAEAVLHFVFAADLTGSAASLELSEDRAIVLEGVRRAAIGTYLFAITLGLASIMTVASAVRLHHRHRTLTAHGKRSTVANVAVARKLCGFLWAAMTHQPLREERLVG